MLRDARLFDRHRNSFDEGEKGFIATKNQEKHWLVYVKTGALLDSSVYEFL